MAWSIWQRKTTWKQWYQRRVRGAPMSSVLVVGSGGREHAIVWKLLQSNQVSKVFISPGNGGTALLSPRVTNFDVKVEDINGLVDLAKKNNVDLVIVGPEIPLVNGITDAMKKAGIHCFGPSSKAAIIEGSKAFSKAFMTRHKILTAGFASFSSSQFKEALEYVRSVPYNVVIKASGLASGKGVLIPDSKKEAEEALKRIMVEKEFGNAGDEVVIEERIVGEEASIMAFSDGYSVRLMPSAQDHKRIFDNDQGLNTGGMGAYAPAPLITQALQNEILQTVMQPTIDGMRKEGRPYVGVLYAGVMIGHTSQHSEKSHPKIYVLEFNCRMGDPETQVILPLLDSDFYEVLIACVEGRLDSIDIKWKPNTCAISVIFSAKGYPANYEKGQIINGLKDFPGSQDFVFHAGTTLKDGNLITSGGRVLAVTALDKDIPSAISRVYEAVKRVEFSGMHYRKDIGAKALSKINIANDSKKALNYSDSGVDMQRGDAVVNSIIPFAKSTKRPGADSDLGGFGALFDLKAAGFKDPILVSGTDGVGTKLKIAQSMNIHNTIGIDLVAMCVNDVVVQGAEPLFFLDYFATGKIEVGVASQVISGIASGCLQSGSALVGGETAEMPGMYSAGEYDLAGFSVGAVEREAILPQNVVEGDIILGLESTGVHSNGFSLVRLLVEKEKLSYFDPAPFESGVTVGEALLRPTKIYVKSCLKALKVGGVKGFAHITGGGITENLPRVLPDYIHAEIDLSTWKVPPIFQWLLKLSGMDRENALKTWNCGFGMLVIVDKERVSQVESVLSETEKTNRIGRDVKNGVKEPSVHYVNTQDWLK
eukprot:TRINITY_DN5949_c0_g1_i2.p1 TRINITY_DN5949_c0_g1~~TRINITY_DN5949_c0_g1_i2.p1  ORF type:complete len:821 (-),score=219.63 TRINITY_DN5949_c0_g1_i2:47-2509(-)